MLGCGSPCEELFADEALADALADDDEHLADLVCGCAACALLIFVFGNHVSRAAPLTQLPY